MAGGDDPARPVREGGARLVRGLTVAGVSLLLAACGSGSGARPVPTFPPSYDWALVADVRGDGPDAQVYRAVRTGCDTGQQALDAQWDRLTSPREVVLFAAAIQMCKGDPAGGLARFQQASTYGWNGLGPDRNSARCAVYTALTVTLNRVAPAVVSCPGGQSPAFLRSPSGVTDNPLTPENEAAPPPVAPATTSSSPPTTTSTPRPTTTTRPRTTTTIPSPTTTPKPRTTTKPVPTTTTTTTRSRTTTTSPDAGTTSGSTTTDEDQAGG
ncbi:hypothetical protein LWC35_09470 [Pseudonocardia kujensis]|uniref:hypothetical protein n=1 Tax=Pseudonocardia kujensis TaxID=1128675 RepID=UPI001E4F17AD|nr:hypothetical protein [Pseudonocardia kujensis]MCE0763136.1 hypothetical protein [Pseudonocardia kujensis]